MSLGLRLLSDYSGWGPVIRIHRLSLTRHSAKAHSSIGGIRGVVVPERGGTPFRQIFLSRNGVPVNIVYKSQPER